MDSVMQTPKTPVNRRRSSIFKPKIEVPIQETAESNVEEEDDDYPASYKEALQKELQQWHTTLKTLHREYEQCKKNLLDISEVTVVLEKKDLEFFDHSLYYEYLQSVQNLCGKAECLLDEKKQNINIYRKIEVAHNFTIEKLKDAVIS